MIYGCIECKKIWCSQEKFDLLDKLNLDLENRLDISHGLCPECISKRVEMIHRSQRKQGYSECYNTNDDCTNLVCCFKPYCGEKSLCDWRSNVVLLFG